MASQFNLSCFSGTYKEFKHFAAHLAFKRGAKITFSLWKHKKDKRFYAWTINRIDDAIWTGNAAKCGFVHKRTFTLTPKLATITERGRGSSYRGYHGQDSGH